MNSELTNVGASASIHDLKIFRFSDFQIFRYLKIFKSVFSLDLYPAALRGGAELGGVETLHDGGGEGEGAGVGDVVVGLNDVLAFVKAVDVEVVVTVGDGDIVAETAAPSPARGGADGLEAGGSEALELEVLHVAVAGKVVDDAEPVAHGEVLAVRGAEGAVRSDDKEFLRDSDARSGSLYLVHLLGVLVVKGAPAY